MSNQDVQDIFDAVGEMAKASILAQRISEKKAQVRSVTKRVCGNCDHWMKSTCKPEKEHGRFKSMNGLTCIDYKASYSSLMLKEEFEAELSEIQGAGHTKE